VTSKQGHFSRFLKECSSCFTPQQEKEKDPPPEKKKDVLVNHHALLEGTKLRPSQPIMLKKCKRTSFYEK